MPLKSKTASDEIDAIRRNGTLFALSVVISRLEQRASSGEAVRLTLGDVVAELGTGSFGGLLVALALPAIPMPPGIAALLGAPLLLLSVQMLLGLRRPWLPRSLQALGLARPAAAKLIQRLRPGVSRLESVLRPRAMGLFNALHDRLVAMACVALSAVLLTPAPFAHTAAALGLVAFASGLIWRDGLALIAGWVLSVACALLLALLVSGVVAAARVL